MDEWTYEWTDRQIKDRWMNSHTDKPIDNGWMGSDFVFWLG